MDYGHIGGIRESRHAFLGVSLLAGFIGFSTLIAGIIGIGNIMWVIVRERTQEIGIRRALGAKPRDIIVQILSEGMALTFIAGTAGITFRRNRAGYHSAYDRQRGFDPSVPAPAAAGSLDNGSVSCPRLARRTDSGSESDEDKAY